MWYVIYRYEIIESSKRLICWEFLCDITLWWILTDGEATMVKVMAWCLTLSQHMEQRGSSSTQMRQKVRITGPLWRESTGDRWIPITKGH